MKNLFRVILMAGLVFALAVAGLSERGETVSIARSLRRIEISKKDVPLRISSTDCQARYV